MKLAEALILRADCKKRIEQIKQRLMRNAKVQEGDEPAEDPEKLLSEMEKAVKELLSLIQRINRTNAASFLADGQTLSDGIAMRDVLKMRSAIYRELAQAATITQDRFSRSEVRFKQTVDVLRIQKQSDDLACKVRMLDMNIQEANWKIVLMD